MSLRDAVAKARANPGPISRYLALWLYLDNVGTVRVDKTCARCDGTGGPDPDVPILSDPYPCTACMGRGLIKVKSVHQSPRHWGNVPARGNAAAPRWGADGSHMADAWAYAMHAFAGGKRAARVRASGYPSPTAIIRDLEELAGSGKPESASAALWTTSREFEGLTLSMLAALGGSDRGALADPVADRLLEFAGDWERRNERSLCGWKWCRHSRRWAPAGYRWTSISDENYDDQDSDIADRVREMEAVGITTRQLRGRLPFEVVKRRDCPCVVMIDGTAVELRRYERRADMEERRRESRSNMWARVLTTSYHVGKPHLIETIMPNGDDLDLAMPGLRMSLPAVDSRCHRCRGLGYFPEILASIND